jgi:ABC-type dipeptide/oligopeptide/nickel transport system permease component
MLNYILRRLWGIMVMLLLLSMFTFALSRIVPGGPWMQGAQEIPLPPEAVEAFKAKYGMDKPVWQQYLVWLRNALTLDFGRPFSAPDVTVAELILKHLPYSATVGGIAAVLALVLGVTLGMLAVARPGSWLDNLVISWAVVIGVIPSFILAYILVFIFSAKLHWLPAGGWDTARNLILPVAAFGIPASGGIARWTRQCMLEAMSSDYVRTAYAKGVRQAGVLTRHVLRNALIPMITSFLPIFPGMMTGSIFIEKVFGLPGLGQYFVTSSTNRDYPLVLGITMFWAILISLTYLLTDILYGVIDPRVRIQEKTT